MAIPHLRSGGYMAATSGGTNAAASSSYGGGGGGGGGSSNQQRPPVFGSGGAGGGGGSSGDYKDDKNPAIPQPDNNQGDNNQDNNQEDSQVTETKVKTKKKKKKKSFDVIETIKDFYNDYKDFGGIMGIGLLPFKMIAEPTVETFQNPKSLATLKLLFDEKGQKFKDEYLKDHGDILSEAYADDPTKDVRGLSDSDFFDEQLQEGAFASEQGILGAGSQRINFPAEFYTGEKGLNPYGAGGMPQTSGDLANLAGLAVTPEMQGANPELAKMIFAARMELDRMGKNPMTGESQGQPQGIPSIPGIPSLPVPRPGPIPPDSYPLPGQPPFMPGFPPNFMPFPGQPPYGSKFERPRPYNYFAQSPQYRFRGIPSVNTDAFNEELRNKFGVA